MCKSGRSDMAFLFLFFGIFLFKMYSLWDLLASILEESNVYLPEQFPLYMSRTYHRLSPLFTHNVCIKSKVYLRGFSNEKRKKRIGFFRSSTGTSPNTAVPSRLRWSVFYNFFYTSILFRMLLEYVCIAAEALVLLGTRAAMIVYTFRLMFVI